MCGLREGKDLKIFFLSNWNYGVRNWEKIVGSIVLNDKLKSLVWVCWVGDVKLVEGKNIVF